MRTLRILAIVLCLASILPAEVTLYSFGPDMGYAQTFTAFTTGGSKSPLFPLGDGSQAFNGGVTYNPKTNLFYAIENDWLGNSSLLSFSLAGPPSLSAATPIGQGFLSGLAYDGNADMLFAISTDAGGHSSLNTISWTGSVATVMPLGDGFFGGLTFRPSDGLLYAFSDLGGAQQQFNSIDAAGLTLNPLFALTGQPVSFSGGVAFNPEDGRFYAISSDPGGNSFLQNFAVDGTGLSTPAPIGGAFWNAGLVAVPAQVPEPSSLCMMAVFAAACLSLGLRRR